METSKIKSWEKEFIKEFHDYHMDNPDDVLLDGVTSGRVRLFISEVELDARKDERDRVLGEVEKAKTFSVTHPKMFGGEVEETYINKKDIISILKSLSGNNE